MNNFIEKLEALNLSLTEKNGELILKGRDAKLTKEELQLLKENKPLTDFIRDNKEELVQHLSKGKKPSQSKPNLSLKNISSIYELSSLQEGMLFHGLYDKNSKAYVIQLTLDLPEGVDIDAFRASWDFSLKNHTALRSSFVYDRVSTPLQCVHKELSMPFEIIDFSEYPESEIEDKFAELLEADQQKGFDFEEAPLTRVILVKVGENAYKMIWSHHHIIWDGWSVQVLMGELLVAYEYFAKGETPPEQKEDRYEDYIKYVNSLDRFEEETFWNDYMKGFETASLLPFVNNQLERNKGEANGRELKFDLDVAITEKIKDYAQNQHLTVSTLVQGAWSFLLAKYTGNPDTAFGVTVSGRPTELEGSEQRVGLYINTLPLRSQIAGEQKIEDWLTEIQKGHTQAREYQYTALNTIQNWIGLQGDFVDSILVFQNFPVGEVLKKEWMLKAENVHIKDQNNYLLTIVVGLRENLTCTFKYNESLLTEEQITMIRNHFEAVIRQIVEPEKENLNEIELLTTEEKHELIEEFNAAQFAYPKDQTVLDLFAAQAAKTPNETAVVFKGKTFTYADVDAKSDRLAAHLQANYEVKKNDLVGIMMERSEWWIVSILGIMKAGGAYVPIDLEYPQRRKSFIIEDTKVKALIIESDQLFEVVDYAVPVFSIDVQFDELPTVETFKSTVQPSDLAYVIYTSGSTGNPKGVLVNHQNLAASCQARKEYYGAFDSMILISSFAFDSSVAVVWGTLLTGGKLILPQGQTIKTPSSMRKILGNQQIDGILCVPSYYQFLLDEELIEPTTFKRVIVAGEKLTPQLAARHFDFSETTRLFNEYGPTEGTVWSSVAEIKKDDKTISIGKPVHNVQIYVVDRNNDLIPQGLTGELCIGGDQVTQGYLNRPELTAEKFIDHPFDTTRGAKVYKTGDLVRWLPNGNLDFVGRKDDQVKILGYRIELGEIEAALLQSPGIRKGVVITREDANGTLQLVAYVVTEDTFDKEAVLLDLKAKLPIYMVPKHIVNLLEMPITANGKIDKKALPDPNSLEANNVNYVAPRNEIEERLVAIWKELLNVGKVGIYDDFFALGGHSLLAIRVSSAIKREFSLNIPIKVLFEFSNIADLYEYILLVKRKANEETLQETEVFEL